MLRWTAFFLAGAFCFTVATGAHADCAVGSTYEMEVTGSTVTVGLENSDRLCGDASGMLRQNESTGEVDVLANNCGTDSFGDPAYIDECVAPGTYRYGFALPYDCTHRGCGGVAVFKEATVTAALSPTCMRASTDPGPTVTNEVPPWGTGANPDSGKSCPGAGCFCDTATASVASMNTFALGIGLAVVFAARKRRSKSR